MVISLQLNIRPAAVPAAGSRAWARTHRYSWHPAVFKLTLQSIRAQQPSLLHRRKEKKFNTPRRGNLRQQHCTEMMLYSFRQPAGRPPTFFQGPHPHLHPRLPFNPIPARSIVEAGGRRAEQSQIDSNTIASSVSMTDLHTRRNSDLLRG